MSVNNGPSYYDGWTDCIALVRKLLGEQAETDGDYNRRDELVRELRSARGTKRR